MKIFSDQQLKPKIEQVLTQIEDHFLFHQNYGLKHPLALFNTSFNKIEESLQDFFKIYDGITFEQLRQTQGGDIPVREIIKSYRTHLYSLREYLWITWLGQGNRQTMNSSPLQKEGCFGIMQAYEYNFYFISRHHYYLALVGGFFV